MKEKIITKICFNVSQLTAHERKIFNCNKICQICGNTIFTYQGVAYQKIKSGRFMYYKFMHKTCYNDQLLFEE